jgi:hypothetical protein
MVGRYVCRSSQLGRVVEGARQCETPKAATPTPSPPARGLVLLRAAAGALWNNTLALPVTLTCYHASCLCAPDVLLDHMQVPSLSATRTNPALDTTLTCNRQGLIAGLGGRAGLTKTTTPVSRFPFSHTSPPRHALVSSHVIFRLGFARLSAQ